MIDETNPVQKSLVRSLQEHFTNEKLPSDGLIYQRIRYYEGKLDAPPNPLAANHWWSMLEVFFRGRRSKKGQYLKSFFKHPTLPPKLDMLLVIPGIWDGLHIGLLHKVLAMKCDEVKLPLRDIENLKLTINPSQFLATGNTY